MALETLAEFSPEEILSILPRKKHAFKINGQEFVVKTCSLRLKVFQRSLQCIACGILGCVFKLQKQANRNESPHLNLYGLKKTDVGDEWVLITKDHIRPRSKGGKDRLDNLQTMCIICNEKKGSTFEYVGSSGISQ